MKKPIGEGMVSPKHRTSMPFSYEIREQHPPGTLMCLPTRKFWCPEFLLRFHYVSMNDRSAESLAASTQFSAS